MPTIHSKSACLRNAFIAVLSMSFSNLISVAIFATLLVRVTCAKYYPDIVYEIGTSCSEKTMFATTKDPFYQWITRSYLVDGFQYNRYITIQEAGTSYKKLSEWRVADNSSDGSVKMFNSLEPHVIGGFFKEHPRNLIAKMTVDWGLSIRICLGSTSLYGDADAGQNICRYTGQVIAVKKNGKTDFNMLLSQVYFKNTQEKVSYLTNWVSNARVPGAVGENRTRLPQNGTEYWYYSNPLLEKSCGSSQQFIYYSPDMAAFLGDSYEECACVENVCVQTFSVSKLTSGLFQNSTSYPCNNQSVKSYWRALGNGFVYLYSFSSKFEFYYVLTSTFTSGFPNNVSTIATVYEMGNFSSCFEKWLEDQQGDPTSNLASLSFSCNNNEVINWTWKMVNYSHAIFANSVTVVLQTVKQAVATGDNCQENSKNETVCSSDILAEEEKHGIENIISNFSQIKDVKNYAKSQWDQLGTKLHDAYVDIVTAILSFFTATVAVFSKKLVQIEHKVVSWVSKHCICRQGKTKAEQVYLDEQNIQQKEQLRPQVLESPQVQSSLAVTFVRTFIRLAILGGVTANFAVAGWGTLRNLKSGPDATSTQTIEYQSSTSMAFLVTVTSTINVAPKWASMYTVGAITLAWFLFTWYRICKHVSYWPLAPKPSH